MASRCGTLEGHFVVDLDLILAGGGLTQASNLIDLRPKSWLAGVSLIRPDLAYFEHKCLVRSEKEKIEIFCSLIEKPFFELCKQYGWHCVHKFLLGHVHGFSAYERRPMSQLNKAAGEHVAKVWDTVISGEINEFIVNG